jgi:hypothetical protein
MDFHRMNRFWQRATLLIAPALLVVLIWLKPTMNPFQFRDQVKNRRPREESILSIKIG